MKLTSRSRQGLALVAGLALTLPLLVGQACLPGAPAGAGGGAPSVEVLSPSLDQTAAVGDRVTVVYSVISEGATSISAFYDRDGQAGTGDEVVFMEDLPKGQNKYTQLLTWQLGSGTYRIGVTVTNSAGTTTAYGVGRVTLVGGPQIAFTSPAGALRVAAGVRVPIEFDAGVNSFSWRTFYDTNGSFDGDEITILQGSNTDSPTVATSFDTSALTGGTFYVGAEVSTPSGGVGRGYAPGTVTIISGAFVQLLAPTVGLVATPGTPIQIIVAANDPGNTASTIRLFYDFDNTFGNGNENTITSLPVTGTTATWDTTPMATGSYWVGAELVNGLTPPLVSYSAGPVQIGMGVGAGGGGGPGGGGGDSALLLTTPQTDMTILQNRTYRISWTTNLRVGEGTVTVFREPDLDKDGQRDGPATRVIIGNPGNDVTRQYVDFDTAGVVGKFFIGATLTPISGAPIEVYAPGSITVRPLLFWVGELLTKKDATGQVIPQTGPFQGAVFQGHHPQDNLGTAMLRVDDYDDDGFPEILLAAQYGKPFNQAQDGRGAGEAYMIYGKAQRFSGTIGVNGVGVTLPGLLFTGIMPNPYAGDTPVPPSGFDSLLGNPAMAGNSIPYTVDGRPAPPNATEGLRSVIAIPDQDGDGKQELVFSFPWCNSYSLHLQGADRYLQDFLPGFGRLENNGHFLRGGLVIVSSQTSLMYDRTAISRRLDRVLELHQVGQAFSDMTDKSSWPGRQDNCEDFNVQGYGDNDTWIFPCEGFFQNTQTLMSPPRLANPLPRSGWILHPVADVYNCLWNVASLTQIDPPYGPTDPLIVGHYHSTEDAFGEETCIVPNTNEPIKPPFGTIWMGGTGFYSSGASCAERQMASPREPYGYRLLGQETTQPELGTVANRFGHCISISNDFLLVGAPRRTALQGYVGSGMMPEASRPESGEVYMIRLRRPGAGPNAFPYAVPTQTPYVNLPYPHNWIVDDVGFYVFTPNCDIYTYTQNYPDDNISRPFRVVGAAAGDHIGEATGAHDINNDGVSDMLVGGAGTNGGRGAVYVIYRRQQEVEFHYMLERLQLDPTNVNRLNGLMIIGEPGENLGTAVAAGGPLNDDFNNDGFPDALIGSPRATPAARFMAGQTFILFGGQNLLSPVGGSTIAELRDAGYGMLITGAHAGDMSGMTVANAGDVNGDGIPDILIAAPEASPRFDSDGDGIADTIGMDLDGNRVPDDLDGDGTPDDMTNAGLVYVVFGGKHLKGTISLSAIGTGKLPATNEPGWGLPGFVIVGRKGGDRLGGGYVQPSNPLVPETGYDARGVNTAGDLDRDGRADLLISSVLADPKDGNYAKENAGEVYLIYGLTP